MNNRSINKVWKQADVPTHSPCYPYLPLTLFLPFFADISYLRSMRAFVSMQQNPEKYEITTASTQVGTFWDQFSFLIIDNND